MRSPPPPLAPSPPYRAGPQTAHGRILLYRRIGGDQALDPALSADLCTYPFPIPFNKFTASTFPPAAGGDGSARTGSCLAKILVLQRHKQTTAVVCPLAELHSVLCLAANLAINQLIMGKARPARAFFPSKRKSLQDGNGLGKKGDSSAASP